MVTTPSPIRSEPTGEQRVIFHHLNWQAYQNILSAIGEKRAARLTYSHGVLEITMPLEDHEFASELIGRFIYFLVAELGLKVKSMGSTTLDREDLDRGAEPDKAYYIQNQSKVAGRKVNLRQDPPPDLVVEVDITHSDIDKLRLYAEMGVPEFWRYDGVIWRVYQLRSHQYEEVKFSPTFPFVPKQKFYEFLQLAQQDEVAAEQALRNWVRSEVRE